MAARRLWLSAKLPGDLRETIWSCSEHRGSHLIEQLIVVRRVKIARIIVKS